MQRCYLEQPTFITLGPWPIYLMDGHATTNTILPQFKFPEKKKKQGVKISKF